MASIEKNWNSLTYPIHEHIRWEIGDTSNRQYSWRESDNVTNGKTEWHLFAKIDDSKKVLEIGIILHLGFRNLRVHRILRLINQQGGEDKVYERDIMYPRRRRHRTSIEWSKLVSGGFIKDDKMIVECSVRIDLEDKYQRRAIDFRFERPNEEDLEIILEKRELLETVEKEIEVPISSIENRFSERFTLFGLPAKLELCNGSGIQLHLNSDDGSDWWRCLVSTQCLVATQNDERSRLFSPCVHLYQRGYSRNMANVTKWHEPLDPSKGLVKNGNLKFKFTFRMLEWYGFDEKTNRGIEKPMRRMTDVGLIVHRMTEYRVAKKILAQQSSYFRDLFASNPEESKFDIQNVEMNDFRRFLELVHNVGTNIHEESIEGVLEVINRFEAPECFKRCALVLKRKEFKDPMKVLDWLDKYPLPGLIDDDFILSMKRSRKFMCMSHEEKKEILDRINRLKNESIREEQLTDFKEETNLTDVKIEMDGHIYYASKQILSNASYYFMKRFYGPYSEDETDISDLKVSPSNFELLLTHIYHPTRPVTSANLDSLLQLAHQFSVPRLMDKCEEYLVLNDSVSLIDKLEYAGKFDLPYLLEACLKFAKDTEKMKEVKSDSKYSQLPENIRNELTKRESGELQ